MRIADASLELPPEDGARAVVRRLVEEAADAAEALAAGTGEEPLHDFRVALRRLRTALRTFAPWLGDDVRRRHVKRLRRLARSTSATRDADVQLAWLAGRRGELSTPAHRPGLAAAIAWLEARRDEGPAPEKIARRFRRLGRKLRRRLGPPRPRAARRAPPSETFAAVLADLALEHVGDLADRLATIRDAADVEAAHRARIQAKRLRYLVEPLRGSTRAGAGEVVRALKALQDLLGDLHDAHVLAAELGDVLAEASAERTRRVHAAALAPARHADRGARTGDGDAPDGGAPASVRDALRGSPRPGLLALVGLVRARRDTLFADLTRAIRGGAVEALARSTRALAEAMEGREGTAPEPGPTGSTGRPAAAREARPAARRRARRSPPGSSGAGRPARAP